MVRLSNGDKMAILEAIRTPGFKREGIMKLCKPNELDIGFTESYSVLLTPRKKEKIVIHLIFSKYKRSFYNFGLQNPDFS